MSTETRRTPHPCQWCGRPVDEQTSGRRRRYCKQSCRQRAYEQRSLTSGTSISDDAVILSKNEFNELVERLFVLRCAVEDIDTAIAENAAKAELALMSADLLTLARDAERLR